MIHPPLNLDELHSQQTVNRIAAGRAMTRPLPSAVSTPATDVIARARQRLGSTLIAIGERLGGPSFRLPRPITPSPPQTPAPSV